MFIVCYECDLLSQWNEISYLILKFKDLKRTGLPQKRLYLRHCFYFVNHCRYILFLWRYIMLGSFLWLGIKYT